MRNHQNNNCLNIFVRKYWGCLLATFVAVLVFLYCTWDGLQEHLAYKRAQSQGDLLSMGEMRVNDSGVIRDDGTIELLAGGTMYGPYFDYEAGSYILNVVFDASGEVTEATISVTSSGGANQLGSFPLRGGENQIQVVLAEDQRQLEIVLRNEGTGIFEITSLLFYPGILPEQVEENDTLPTPIPSEEPTGVVDTSIDLLPDVLYSDRVTEEEGMLILSQGGYLYGPYIDLEPGNYQMVLECEFDQQVGSLSAQVTAENGSWIITTQEIISGVNIIPLSITQYTKGIEIVMRNEIFDEIKVLQIELIAAA